MRLGALALAFVLLVATKASALKQPKSKEEITELAAIGTSMANEKKNYADKKAQLEFLLKRESGLNGNKRIADKILGQISALESTHAGTMTEIVQRTVKLFDINPGPNSGVLMTAGPLKNRPVNWTPTYAPEATTKKVQLGGNKEVLLKVEGDYEGITWVDGSVEVNEKAFVSPGYLGAILYHESVHFEQLTTTRAGNQSAARAEMEAHSKSSSKTAASVFALTADEEKAIKKSFARQMEIFRNNPSMTVTAMQLASGEALLQEKLREARELAAKQRERQEQQRQADHDGRLRQTIISLTQRSCDNPGSVTQAELTALPRPYQKASDFRWMAPLEPRDFPGREHCVNIYEYLAYSGRNAEELRKASTPPQMPAPIVAVPVSPISSVPPVEATKTPFSRVLPDFKSYSVSACGAPQQIRGDVMLFRAYDHSARTFDDALIGDLKNSMDDCSRKLFDYLIAANRRNDYDALKLEAIQAKVRALTPAYPGGGGGGGYAPPRNNVPGCEYDPNIGGIICPKSL